MKCLEEKGEGALPLGSSFENHPKKKNPPGGGFPVIIMVFEYLSYI